MSLKRIVLVLGAGASSPYGFPTGPELISLITSEHGRDPALLRVLRSSGVEEESIVAFRSQLQAAAPRSIDRFLELNEDHRSVGRAFIAALLIQREQPSNLLEVRDSQRWYGYLWDFIETDRPEDLFKDDRLSVVTFNYDRSLEYWLINKIQHYYGMPRSLAIPIARRLKIVHVHGRIGGIEAIEANSRVYEPHVNEASLQIAMREMRLIGEAAESDRGFQEAHDRILYANLILFLGFGYHRTNIQRLKLHELCADRTSRPGWEMLANMGIPGHALLRGTALGLTESERRRTLGTAFGSLPITVADETVLTFLRNNAEYFHWA